LTVRITRGTSLKVSGRLRADTRAVEGRRYGPAAVSEVRLECRSPTGNLFEALAVGGFVLAPETLKAEPGMWWLEREGYPRLDAETSCALNRVTAGNQVGPWAYRVPAARWNEAAVRQPWLPAAPIVAADASDFGSRLMPERRADSREMLSRSTSLRDRVCDGAAAVAGLFAHTTRAGRFLLTACALGACAYYVVAAAAWLWSLRDGMTASETQAGVVNAGFALVATWITGRFEEQPVSASGVLVRRPRAEARGRQPLLHLVLDAYRVGVVLQLLAFAGFVLT
jgi:hypothetical protein